MKQKTPTRKSNIENAHVGDWVETCPRCNHFFRCQVQDKVQLSERKKFGEDVSKAFEEGRQKGICESTYPLAYEKGKQSEQKRILEIIEEEIDYVKNKVRVANRYSKGFCETIDSYIFEARRIKKQILETPIKSKIAGEKK